MESRSETVPINGRELVQKWEEKNKIAGRSGIEQND
jgi:hypothetical protein